VAETMAPVAQFCHWLQNTDVATGMRQSDLWFPLIEGTHILALSFSVGMILMLDLRLLKVSFVRVAVPRIMDSIMPWALPGFVIMLVTGLLLFAAQAEKVSINRFFQIKLVLLAVLGGNALLFQFKYYPAMSGWEQRGEVPRGASVVGMVSLVLWSAVITCGRLMAYEI
jgi:hypothetical protein